MARPRVRWADGPDDRPGPNEIIGRLERVGFAREHYPGAGRAAPRVALGDDGELYPVTEPRPTDLSVTRATIRMTVEHGDGRRLVARFGLDADEPQAGVGAPADLRDAVIRLWRERNKAGPPSGTGVTYAHLVDAVRNFAGEPSQDAIAGIPGMPGPRSLSRIAAPYGGWRAVLRDAGRS